MRKKVLFRTPCVALANSCAKQPFAHPYFRTLAPHYARATQFGIGFLGFLASHARKPRDARVAVAKHATLSYFFTPFREPQSRF